MGRMRDLLTDSDRFALMLLGKQQGAIALPPGKYAIGFDYWGLLGRDSLLSAARRASEELPVEIIDELSFNLISPQLRASLPSALSYSSRSTVRSSSRALKRSLKRKSGSPLSNGWSGRVSWRRLEARFGWLLWERDCYSWPEASLPRRS